MKNIVFYAPPAAGKGIQCELLQKNKGYKVLSIGQVLRDNRNPETEVGRIIIETQDKGILTPDEIVGEALKNELSKFKDNLIIIDGYPRNLNQAKLLDTIFDNYIVINLSVDRDIALKRITGRVNCPVCKKIYNIYSEDLAPKKEGICDVCGSALNKRDDDTEVAFNVRYDIYENNAKDILEYYNNKNILYVVEADTPEKTYQKIEEIINDL